MGSCAAQIILWSLISILATIVLAVIIFAAYVAGETERFISAFNQQFDLFCETLPPLTYREEVYIPYENGVYEKPLAIALMDISTNTSISNCSNILPIPNPPGFTHQLRVEGLEPINGAKLMFAYIFWNRHLCHAAIALSKMITYIIVIIKLKMLKHLTLNVIQSPDCDGKVCGKGKLIGRRYVCPHNNFMVKYPKISIEWCYDNNDKSPHEFLPHSTAKVWWICPINPCGCHIYQASIDSRVTKRSGCPYCGSKKLCIHNNFAAKYPQLASEWDYNRNIITPDLCSPGTNKEKYWWKCPNNFCGCHIYDATINNRVNGKNCPYCFGNKICHHNNLVLSHPDLIKEWDYERNNKRPDEYASMSKEKVWWICPRNQCGCHRYYSEISQRTRLNSGCPYCSGRYACDHNNLAIMFPKLTDEWDCLKNTNAPHNYLPFSHEKVWWKCNNQRCPNDSYHMPISKRTARNSGCPSCNKSIGENIIVTVLHLLNIDFSREWIHPYLPRKRYDFKFVLNGINHLIEYDGEHHFKQNKLYHKDKDAFLHRKEIDKIKTYVAYKTDYKIIRIDYRQRDQASIIQHINLALASNEKIYYSNTELYSFLSEPIDNSLLLTECPFSNILL